jgi:hypothetical protein
MTPHLLSDGKEKRGNSQENSLIQSALLFINRLQITALREHLLFMFVFIFVFLILLTKLCASFFSNKKDHQLGADCPRGEWINLKNFRIKDVIFISLAS